MKPVLRSMRVAVLVLVPLLLLACGSDNDDPTGPEHGSVAGTVEDTAGQGVPGAAVLLWRNSDELTATSGSDGSFTFNQVAAGGWTLEVTPPEGFEIDPGQQMPVQVQVQAGQTANVTVRLQGEDPNDDNDDPDDDLVEVTALGASFSPSDRTIEPGTTVRWVNDANIEHTVTPDGHSEWNEATLTSEGDNFEHTFESEGDFSYLCTIHAGMTGVIRVEND